MSNQQTVLRPERPDPICMRQDWLTLNGVWEFRFDPANEGEQRHWRSDHPSAARAGGVGGTPFRQYITAPFPWESPLSGITEPGYQGVAWYRRVVTLPAGWTASGLQPVLRFGAVGWEARVWVNSHVAGDHVGGCTPFSIDLTSFLNGDAPLTVVVRLRGDGATPLAKQVTSWYTHTSGIWQTV